MDVIWQWWQHVQNASAFFPILVFLVVFLSDALRKKRRYKPRKGPVPVPERRSKAGQTMVEEPVLAPVPPVVIRQTTTVAMPSQMVAPATVSTTTPVVVTPVRREEPIEGWQELTPETRDIYAGLVWAELWEPPVSQRYRYRHK